MRAFLAIFKRELTAYFSSPIAYVVLVIFSFLSAWFYVIGYLFPFSDYCERYPMLQMQMQQNPMMRQEIPVPNFTELVLPGYFGTLSIVLIFLLPLLTMRTISEEKRQGTIELLYTYPVSDLQVVLAKYLACLVVFVLCVLLVVFYLLLPDWFAAAKGGAVIQWKPALSALLGFTLLGSACIALGFIFSAMTENQIVAAALTFTLLLFLWVVGWATQGDNIPPYWKSLAEAVSLTNRSQDLFKGLIHLSDLAFYACVMVGSLFITMRTIESHRWRA